MMNDVSVIASADSVGEFRIEADWLARIADFEHWNGLRAGFCEVWGVPENVP